MISAMPSQAACGADLERRRPSTRAMNARVGSSAAVLFAAHNGETNGSASEIYEIDPELNTSVHRFTMDGYFYGLFRLQP